MKFINLSAVLSYFDTAAFTKFLVLFLCFFIVIMVIFKKEVRCVLLTCCYWYYLEKVSKTLQQCFWFCLNKLMALATCWKLNVWVINFFGLINFLLNQSITTGNLFAFKREEKIESFFLVIFCWITLDGLLEKLINTIRAAGEASVTAFFRIEGWQAALIINVGLMLFLVKILLSGVWLLLIA